MPRTRKRLSSTARLSVSVPILLLQEAGGPRLHSWPIAQLGLRVVLGAGRISVSAPAPRAWFISRANSMPLTSALNPHPEPLRKMN